MIEHSTPKMEAARNHYLQGRDVERRGHPAEAAVSYRRAIALAPDMAPAHAMLGQLLLAQRDIRGAKMSVVRALEWNPSLPAALVLMAMVSKEEGNAAEGESSPEFAHNKSNIVFAYREHQRLMEHWKEVLPAASLTEFQYEELVECHERVTRRLISFVGLGWDEACLFPEKSSRVVNTPSMWQVRQPIYKSAVGRWRNYEPWLGVFRDLL